MADFAEWARTEILALKRRLAGLSTLTGVVTATGSGSAAATIANNAVTNAKLADMGAATVKMRAVGAGTGDPIDGTANQLSTLLDTATDPFVRTSAAGSPGGSPSSGEGDSIYTAAYASRPAPANDGDLFLPSNGFVLERDTGAAWVPWGPIFPLTAPVDGDFAWINQGGATVSTTNGGIYLNAPASASMNMRIRKKAAPATPYTITAWILPLINHGLSFVNFGFREAATGELHHWRYGYNAGTIALSVIRSTSPTVDDSSDTDIVAHWQHRLCLRIADNGTNRIFSYSIDGVNFIDWFSVGRTVFLTADEIFFAADTRSATYPAGVTLISWKQG
jgi:hypothetical protein